MLPRRHELVLSRGPYRYDGEHALLCGHRIDALVTKNSGGQMTRSKLDAAAALAIPVVMVSRPPLPPGVTTVGGVDEAVGWIWNLGRQNNARLWTWTTSGPESPAEHIPRRVYAILPGVYPAGYTRMQR